MSEPTQSDAPATPTPDTATSAADATDTAGVHMILRRAIAGVGDKDEPVVVDDADKAARWHDAGYADYLSTKTVEAPAPAAAADEPDDDGPTFRTKREAQEFATEHGLEVEDANAEDYKLAVANAWREQQAAQG